MNLSKQRRTGQEQSKERRNRATKYSQNTLSAVFICCPARGGSGGNKEIYRTIYAVLSYPSMFVKQMSVNNVYGELMHWSVVERSTPRISK